MILNILIATHNNRIIGLKNILICPSNVFFTISHQITEPLEENCIRYVDSLKQQENVFYTQLNSKGVAKNRNNALRYRVKGSICLLCDDDVIYFENAFDKILVTFKKYQELDFLTFKIKTFQGNDYKKYKIYEFKQNLKTLSNIGIIDVAFREEAIEKYNLQFDERFGPGGHYSIGEDFIFMTDAYKKGANIVYKPLDIVQHEDIGTGQILRDDIIFGRGAMFSRVFGYLSFFLNLYFAMKNIKKYKSKYTFIEYNKLLFKGSMDFFRNKK